MSTRWRARRDSNS